MEPYYLFNDISPFEMNQIRPTTQKMQGFPRTGISFDYQDLYRLSQPCNLGIAVCRPGFDPALCYGTLLDLQVISMIALGPRGPAFKAVLERMRRFLGKVRH